MKRSLPILLLSLVAHAAVTPPEPQINADPFEPPVGSFFRSDDKFAQPKQIVACEILWPFEMRRGRSAEIGDVVVLVQIDNDGYPQRLSVLSSSDVLFTRSALLALRKTRWAKGGMEVYFYYRAHFDLGATMKEELNPESCAAQQPSHDSC
jgi:TonB family protein